MYEMRADSPDGHGELLWHVLSKESPSGTLCGRHAPPSTTTRSTAGETAGERYCTPCMEVFRAAVQGHTERSVSADIT
ncbi:hypothetical protein ACWGHM_02220 [Streptomyces sp. NPDC054904]|uniref:hypothetical protein n=1 Tax=unclassified Streptomyces TaxID=2593676 RepID=UPI002481EA49|nr:hypothetical protein [Streptomyces sp. Isolate_45]MDA5281670.1 hypothetical protein [Streptomyces sp. Isolate_45]